MASVLRLSSRRSHSIRTAAITNATAGRTAARSYATSSDLLADQKAEEFHNLYKGTATNGGETKLYINGQFESSQTKDWIDLHDPVSLWGGKAE